MSLNEIWLFRWYMKNQELGYEINYIIETQEYEVLGDIAFEERESA